MFEVRLVKTLWGVEDAMIPERWPALFARIKAEGFAGVEWVARGTKLIDLFESEELTRQFVKVLKDNGLFFIAQVHTMGYPVQSRVVQDHVDSFRTQLHGALQMAPIMVNSHSGHDSWNISQANKFFQEALEIENGLGVRVCHETHRQRLLFNPWQADEIMQHNPQLKFNLDISHWVNVCERVFDNVLDADIIEIIKKIAKQTILIHARVGHAEGPQVNDPAAPEHAETVLAHERWWKIVWQAQKDRGDNVSYVEPEFGPPPYMPTLPFTQQPVADLWQINTKMAHRQKTLFESIYPAPTVPKSPMLLMQKADSSVPQPIRLPDAPPYPPPAIVPQKMDTDS